jgi:hypothetical protein
VPKIDAKDFSWPVTLELDAGRAVADGINEFMDSLSVIFCMDLSHAIVGNDPNYARYKGVPGLIVECTDAPEGVYWGAEHFAPISLEKAILAHVESYADDNEEERTRLLVSASEMLLKLSNRMFAFAGGAR